MPDYDAKAKELCGHNQCNRFDHCDYCTDIERALQEAYFEGAEEVHTAAVAVAKAVVAHEDAGFGADGDGDLVDAWYDSVTRFRELSKEPDVEG